MIGLLKGIVGLIITLFLIILIVVVVVLGLMGYFPFLSERIAFFKPLDLGVTSSMEEFNQLVKELDYKIVAPADFTREEALNYRFTHSGKKSVVRTLTESQLSSILNYHPFFPFIENAQVKIHPDGTVEYASQFILNNLEVVKNYDPPVWVELPGYITQVKNRTPAFIHRGIPVYIKGSPVYSAEKGIELHLAEVKLGKIPLPMNLFTKNAIEEFVLAKLSGFISVLPEVQAHISPANSTIGERLMKTIDEFVNRGLTGLPNFSINSFSFKDGKADFNGSISTQLKIEKIIP